MYIAIIAGSLRFDTIYVVFLFVFFFGGGVYACYLDTIMNPSNKLLYIYVNLLFDIQIITCTSHLNIPRHVNCIRHMCT